MSVYGDKKTENNDCRTECIHHKDTSATHIYGVATGAALAMTSIGYTSKHESNHSLIIAKPCYEFCTKVKKFVKQNNKLISLFSWIL